MAHAVWLFVLLPLAFLTACGGSSPAVATIPLPTADTGYVTATTHGFAVTLYRWRDPALPPNRYVSFYFDAPPGKRWVAVELGVQNTSIIRQNYVADHARLRLGDGRDVTDVVLVGGPRPIFQQQQVRSDADYSEGPEGTRLWPGEARRGWLTFEIPNDAEPVALVFDPAFVRLRSGDSPLAVGTSAAIVVFREGLEAVLILASLLASLHQREQRGLRRPLWWGVVGAIAVTIGTWLVAHIVLRALASYGELVEALVSLLALAVLLLITNWFFHRVYWSRWIAAFHSRKRRLLQGQGALFVGLVSLGFTSVYREGLETVLFTQVLVLHAGMGPVLAGVGVGTAAVIVVGGGLLLLQARLPYKRLLVITGALIALVLVVLAGSTAHLTQEIGWLPEHPLPWLTMPPWLGLWFGVFPSWEGLIAQLLAALVVFGSYLFAERRNQRHTGTTQTAHVGAMSGP